MLLIVTTALIISACETTQSGVFEAPCTTDYAALKAAEMAEIDAGEQVVLRVIRGELPEEEATAAEIAAVERMEEILQDRDRPADDADLAILDRALEILTDEASWDREDDRKCAPDDPLFSLFCAVQLAAIEVTGKYEHRRTAVHEVRYAIEDARPGVDYEHRMRDFNNAPDTTFEEARGVLKTARDRVKARLERQAACAL